VARNARTPIAAWILCATALILLTLVAYGVDSAQRLDADTLARFSSHEGSPAGTIANVLVHLGDPLSLLAMLAAACGIALYRRRPLEALAAVVVVAGANLTTQLLKIALAHPRYQPVLGDHQLGPVAFPSGHSTAAASIAIAFLFVVPARMRPTAAVLGAALAAAVGCSVMVLYWHYPSDVLGGFLVAAGWGFAVLAALRLARENRRRARPAQLSSRPAISVK
jgi:membrane-associated phospholipid phosphatase